MYPSLHRSIREFRTKCAPFEERPIPESHDVLIDDIDLARYTTPGMNPDGSPNKFKRALAAYDREGRIGLQDHGRPVWYRNIRIKPLD